MDQSEWRKWERGANWRAACAQATFADKGLLLGAGTVLVRCGQADPPSPQDETDHDRLVALLCVVKRDAIAANIPAVIAKAIQDWYEGKRALAQIRLAFLKLPRLRERHDAYRLHLADQALTLGLAPDELMKAVGLPHRAMALLKFNSQHRPKGPGGGQFAPKDGDTASVTPAQFVPFEPLIGPLIEGGARLAPRAAPEPISPAEMGAPKSGPLPSPLIEQQPVRPDPGTSTGRKKREINCPPEAPDVKNGSDRGKEYQRLVDLRANGANPTTDGYAYYLPNPEKGGKPKSFDVCVKTNEPNDIPGTEMGDMIDAKNKTYDWLFIAPMFAKGDTERAVSVNEVWGKFKNQVKDQYDSIKGTGRHLFYYFEGQAAADFAKSRLSEDFPDVNFLQCK